jgi:periplasmic nitrate reductase NapD
MANETHIASMIVHVLPSDLKNLLGWLADQSDLEVHAATEEGKVVVVTERPHPGDILQVISAVEEQPGVLSCTMVYHEVMSPEEGDQELLALAPAD